MKILRSACFTAVFISALSIAGALPSSCPPFLKKIEISSVSECTVQEHSYRTGSASYRTGIKTLFADSDMRLYTSLPAVSFSDYQHLSVRHLSSIAADRICPGISVSLQNSTGVPLTLKGGSLALSGEISLLKNPQLSSYLSPGSYSFYQRPEFRAGLPTTGSSVKTGALALEYRWENSRSSRSLLFSDLPEVFVLKTADSQKILFKTIQVAGAVLTDKTFSGVLCTEFTGYRIRSLKVVLAGGRFLLQQKHDDSWYDTTIPFPRNPYYAGLLKLSADFSFLLLQFTEGFQQTPFGTIRLWFRAGQLITCGNFNFSTELFCTDVFLHALCTASQTSPAAAFTRISDDRIRSAGNKRLGNHAQIQIHPRYTWYNASGSRITGGSAALISLQDKNDLMSGYRLTADISAGIQYHTNITAQTIKISFSDIPLQNTGSSPVTIYKIYFSGKHVFSSVPVSAGTTSAWKPHGDSYNFIQTVKLSVSPESSGIRITAEISGSAEEKNFHADAAAVTFSLNGTCTKFNYTFKFALTTEF
ncbi:MAG: hypothetical protein LKF96_11110 [Treponema sp.]|jgi:hypothetical protein|nr:hypothetical protein [Treponema sp.]